MSGNIQGQRAASQAAGLVHASAKYADKRPVPNIRLKDGSHGRLIKKVSGDFKEELELLLLAAGYGGTFTVTVCKLVKGTAHTKGLHIGTPTNHGVTITWHKGSNDNNIEMLLGLPHGHDAFPFQRKLKAAEKMLCEQDDVEEVLREQLVGNGSVHVLPDLRRSGEAQANEADDHDTDEEDDEPEEKQPAAESVGRGIRDNTDARLFIGEVISKGRPSPNGLVPKHVCIDVLCSDFGCAQMKSTGPIINSLMRRGHLKKATPNCYQIGDRWMREFADKLPKPDPAGVQNQKRPCSISPKHDVSPSTKPVTNGSSDKGASLKTDIEQLTRHVRIAKDNRARLREITAETVNIAEHKQMLTNREEALETEADKIRAALEHPDIVDAEKTLATISELLK